MLCVWFWGSDWDPSGRGRHEGLVPQHFDGVHCHTEVTGYQAAICHSHRRIQHGTQVAPVSAPPQRATGTRLRVAALVRLEGVSVAKAREICGLTFGSF